MKKTIRMTNKRLTSTEKSVLFRKRNKELGRSEMRGIIATDAEQKILKKLCRDKLKEMRNFWESNYE